MLNVTIHVGVRNRVLIVRTYQVNWGGGEFAMAQLVEALCYKPGGREFVSRCCHWIFRELVHSGRSVAFESTQLLTEMITRIVSWAGT